MNEVLHVSGLRKCFGKKVALSSVSFSLHAGEMVALLGPNAAGKTTLLKLLCGLLRPTSGVIRVAGIDAAADPIGAKRALCFIPDHPDLYDRLTGWEYLTFVASVYELDRKKWRDRAERLLRHFALDGEAAALIGTYSHGMRQRLCFTAALLPEPSLLLIDEPWVGLDPHHLRSALAALRQAAERGTAILLSTHSVSLVEQIGGRVIILHRGRIKWDGPQEGLRKGNERLEDAFLRLTADPQATQ